MPALNRWEKHVLKWALSTGEFTPYSIYNTRRELIAVIVNRILTAIGNPPK